MVNMVSFQTIKSFQFLVIFGILLVAAGIFLFSFQRSKEFIKINTFAMKISSPVFKNNEFIPAKYTCDGQDVNPPLLIQEVPEGAKSLALIIDDPDAPMGTFVHWIVWNIPPSIAVIKENSLPEGASQGINDFGRNSYGGPCPPSGTHRYYFKLYALDSLLELKSARKEDLERAMRGHIIGKTELVGLYKR